jgi:hypothetical protein
VSERDKAPCVNCGRRAIDHFCVQGLNGEYYQPDTERMEAHVTGAVDLDKCPDRMRARSRMLVCKCGKCSVCGFPKHTAIHGPVNGKGEGSKPYGHEFTEEIEGER